MWFGTVEWTRVLKSFMYVCKHHLTRAARYDGQPLCRKLVLHTLSFIDTAFWLMDVQHPAVALPSSLFIGELIEVVASGMLLGG